MAKKHKKSSFEKSDKPNVFGERKGSGEWKGSGELKRSGELNESIEQNNRDPAPGARIPKDSLLDPRALNKYGNEKDADGLAGLAQALLRQQREHWPMLSEGYRSLETVQVRSLEFDGFEMKLQFNPGRIVSSSAKVDKKSIKARKCFLCTSHLPSEQKGLLAGDYLILGNPFPIFTEHFTIPHLDHRPQLIDSSFEAMLELSEALGGHYTLFYNGPKCGASAPDHLHFQAGVRGFLPLEQNWRDMIAQHGKWIIEEDRFRAAQVDDGLRRYIILESDDQEILADRFQRLYVSFKRVSRQAGITSEVNEEPMLNVLAFMENNRWQIITFLRRRHRPAHYFLEGDWQILFSPASVDFGGVCITPVERDFERLTSDDLREMFGEVSAGQELLDKVAGEW